MKLGEQVDMKQMLTFRSWGFGTFESWIGDDFHFAKLGVINFQTLERWCANHSRGQMPCSFRKNPSVNFCSGGANFDKLDFLLHEVDHVL